MPVVTPETIPTLVLPFRDKPTGSNGIQSIVELRQAPDVVAERKVEGSIKRILFIEPQSGYSTGFNDTVRVETLGPEYLAGAVKDTAECQLEDLRTDKGDLKRALREFQPDLIALKCGYTTDVPITADLARLLKSIAPDLPIVIGGHHISLRPKDLHDAPVDVIVKGEAEDRFPAIVKALGTDKRKLRDIKDIDYRDEFGEWQSNITDKPILNLVERNSRAMNERPAAVRELCDPFRDEYYFLYYQRPYSVETARGCQFRCSFCSVWQVHEGKYRVEGWQRSYEEIMRIPDGSYINIVDDLAIQLKPHEPDLKSTDAWQLAQALIEAKHEGKNDRSFWMQCRADNIDRYPELYTAWAEAGLDMVLVGLESDDPVRRKAVNKGVHEGANERAIQILHDNKIKVWGAQIVFADSPGEYFDHLEEYNKEQEIECPQFTIHTPLPGTVDWKKYYDQLITEDPRFFDFLHPVLPTRLPIREFIARYIKLYRECHMPVSELDALVASGRVTEQGATDYKRKFIHMLRPRTYREAIALHETDAVEAKRREVYGLAAPVAI